MRRSMVYMRNMANAMNVVMMMKLRGGRREILVYPSYPKQSTIVIHNIIIKL